MKIDVEGAELSVLRGAEELIATCRPLLQVEANTAGALQELRAWVLPHGYRDAQPRGFMPWNYLFLHDTAERR